MYIKPTYRRTNMWNIELKYFTPLIVILFSFSCFRGSSSVEWPCTSDLNCTSVESATCSLLGNCRCPVGFIYTSDFTKCIKEAAYGEQCTETVQCSHMLTGSECRDNKCSCNDGYTYLRGRCRQLAAQGEPCDDVIDCQFIPDRESVTCRNNKCDCADGFYHRTENVCRRIAGEDDDCVLQTDCQSDDEDIELACVDSICKRKVSSIGVQTSFSPFKNLERQKKHVEIVDVHIEPLPHRYRQDSNDNAYVSDVDDDDVADSPEYGANCANATQCDGLSHSMCKDGFCVCKPGYYQNKGLCFGELGEVADSVNLCPNITTVEYRDGKCLCKKNFYYQPNLRSCAKVSPGIDVEGCTQNFQCTPFGLSYCNPTFPKNCVCHKYAVHDTEKEMCVSKIGIEEYCKETADCSLKNTVCSDENTCLCAPNYVEKDNDCVPSEGAECNNDEECAIENTECVVETVDEDGENEKKVCRCNSDYIYYMNQCYVKAKKYEDDCDVKEQCEPLLGPLSTCTEKKCTCETEAHHNFGKCNEKKSLGDDCKGVNECFVPGAQDKVECRNSVCKCKLDHDTDVEAQKCRPRPAKGKAHSNRPSTFKVITITLMTTAALIVTAAIRDAYFLQ